MRRRLAQIALGTGLGLIVALAVVLLGAPPERAGDPHLLPAPFSVPATTLTDVRGDPHELPGEHDGPSVVFFGYTSCPDVCPLTVARLARVAETLEAEGTAPPRVVFVSVDPVRDTPGRIAAWLARFDDDFVGLTGSREELEATLSAWGVYAGEAATAGGGAEAGAAGEAGRPVDAQPVLIDHTGRSFLLDRRGRVVGTFPSDATADAVASTIRALQRE